MVRGSRSRRAVLLTCLSAAPLFASLAGAPGAAAFPPPSSSSGSSDDTSTQTPAERAANKGNDLYQQGQYKEAIAAYLEASRLDPNGPNAPILVRNIAVLHEKLGEVDDALSYFRKYGQMDIPADKRRQNEVDIRRLEGAKKELEEKERARQAALAAQQHHDTEPVTTEPPSHGRIDALSIGFAAGAGVALIVGTVFGVKAEAGKPSSGFVAGRDGTYNDLVNRTNVAHNDAVVADVSFGIGIGAAVTAVLLYALRTKDPAPATKGATTTTTSAANLSAAPLPGGGALVVGGAF
jgi:tetratricopeptide (TPR) repeat protein